MARPPRASFVAGLVASAALCVHAPLDAERQRGVSWVAGGEIVPSDLDPLVELGVDWIVQTPFGWQERLDSPEVRLVTGGRVYWGERDEGLEATTRFARERGIRTLLKPHVWLRDRADGAWRGEIAMRTEADWRLWFADYRRFILHYARLAERLQIEALAVGTELHATAVARPGLWRELIAEVRAVYSGALTYSANWYLEAEAIPFWDDLDFIGVQAYFPLSNVDRPTVDELVAGWRPHLATLEALHERTGKPILFTEIGYRSTPDAAIEPWRWPERGVPDAQQIDPETQGRCYEAFFRAVWPRPWLAGAYFWKWYPRAAPDRRRDADFTPQGKPAEAILGRYYGQAGDKAPAATAD